MSGYRIAVAGATGAVGSLMLQVLRRSSLPIAEVVPFATERSEGRELELADAPVRVMREDTIEGFDLALFSAGGSTSREWAPRFVEAGAVVVDNSSAWRMHEDVPLVVSEVNPEALDGHSGIVANPNCTTMVAMLPLKALHDAFGLRSLVATSYQAAGGAGQKGIDELAAQVEPVGRDLDLLINDGNRARTAVESKVHADTLAYNVVPMLGKLVEAGYTDEELKLQNESRKILGLPELAVSPTCVRVPVMVGHAVACCAGFDAPVDLDAALEALEAFPNLVVQDAPT
ncbi:MAG: aspartate-semialdehyde dehydrogenase, partial [Actinomycetota bacterium]|nr:aspartate-semialdehyde dehydrogenase [Actinomycetota bacterium]